MTLTEAKVLRVLDTKPGAKVSTKMIHWQIKNGLLYEVSFAQVDRACRSLVEKGYITSHPSGHGHVYRAKP